MVDPEAVATAAVIPWTGEPWATGWDAAPGNSGAGTGRGAGTSLEEAALERLREHGTSPAAPVAGTTADPAKAGSRRAATRAAGAGKPDAKEAGTSPVSLLIRAGRPPKRWIPVTGSAFGTYVTAWNTGEVGLGTASASSDAPAKRSWTISPSLAGGC
ncbi:hypothetical protein [Streptomyces sp. NBC_00102]|uniref:hypothetical protein n=1 Tax=Streptomyces sp. NBC_00102 TaxID=2975652 RepID=UPI0022529CF5|nr:hypothetical protein [Streptomyces sp. NBC_00102]MCX5401664.1 hypothetical protein [Streptomyces sp. NBC_00102]